MVLRTSSGEVEAEARKASQRRENAKGRRLPFGQAEAYHRNLLEDSRRMTDAEKKCQKQTQDAILACRKYIGSDAATIYLLRTFGGSLESIRHFYGMSGWSNEVIDAAMGFYPAERSSRFKQDGLARLEKECCYKDELAKRMRLPEKAIDELIVEKKLATAGTKKSLTLVCLQSFKKYCESSESMGSWFVQSPWYTLEDLQKEVCAKTPKSKVVLERIVAVNNMGFSIQTHRNTYGLLFPEWEANKLKVLYKEEHAKK